MDRAGSRALDSGARNSRDRSRRIGAAGTPPLVGIMADRDRAAAAFIPFPPASWRGAPATRYRES